MISASLNFLLKKARGYGVVRSIGGDREHGFSDEVDQRAGVREKVLDGRDTLEHVLGDRELPLVGCQGVCQRKDDVGEAWQESTIKITHVDQLLHVQLGLGDGNCLMAATFHGSGPIPLESSVAQEGLDGLGEDTLVQVHCQIVLMKSGEDLPEMVLVVLRWWGCSPGYHIYSRR